MVQSQVLMVWEARWAVRFNAGLPEAVCTAVVEEILAVRLSSGSPTMIPKPANPIACFLRTVDFTQKTLRFALPNSSFRRFSSLKRRVSHQFKSSLHNFIEVFVWEKHLPATPRQARSRNAIWFHSKSRGSFSKPRKSQS